MPSPTIQTVVNELKNWQANADASIAMQATDVLNRLEMFGMDKNKDHLNNLGNELERIVINNNPSPFTETLYHVLYVIGSLSPRNNYVNDMYVDPITLEPIEPSLLFISSDRYQWSIIELVRWNESNNPDIDTTSIYINPLSRKPFNHRDTTTLKALYLEVNPIPQPTNLECFASYCPCFFSRTRGPIMPNNNQTTRFSILEMLNTGLSVFTEPMVTGYIVAYPQLFTNAVSP